MEHTLKDNALTVALHGRIDTVTSPEVDKELSSILTNCKFTSLILDLADVDFVSSAGLRIFLRAKQTYDAVSIINVKQEVYEVFEMTGFTEIMDVEKAYRQFSIDGCEIIGKGAVGTVYRYSDDTIVKVFREGTSLDEIKHEIDISHKAFVLGIPTAISYDVVKVGDSFGTVYELLNCETMKGLILKDQQHLGKYAKMYSDVLHALHKSKVGPGELPSIREHELKVAEIVTPLLPEKEGRKYSKMVNEIPDDYNVCHGDCHIKNIMVQNGEPLFIDMDTLCYGNPVFDFSRAYNTYFGYTELLNQQDDMFIGLPYETVKEFWKLTLMEYFKTKDPIRIEQLENKFALLGNAYLLYKVATLPDFAKKAGKEKIEWLKKTISEEIDKADNLML